MSLLVAENIFQAFGAQVVLKDVTFRLAEDDRIGLVGPNGQGKSTLLKIVAGLMEPTGGKVHRGRSLRMGYLAQDPPAPPGMTVHQAMLEAFNDLRQREQQLHELADQIQSDPRPDLVDRYGLLQSQFEGLGGYDYTSRIERVLSGLGFPRDMWDHRLSELSGGQRTRALLASLLLQNPELLMLDEPTNHLDLDNVEWLESWPKDFRGALIVVSHDRYFLDCVTQHTWEVSFGELERYRGGYSQYVVKRQERYEERLAAWEAQQEYVQKTQDFIARFLAGQRSKEAQGRRTRLERYLRDEAVEKPREVQTISLRISSGKRSGDLAMRTEGLHAGYTAGRPIVCAGDLTVQRGQKIAIVGPNGSGKTTLLRTLLNQLSPLAGRVVAGAGASIGYLSQTQSELSSDQTAVQAVMHGAGCNQERARDLLGSLQLSAGEADKLISQLSGGQRSRVILARLMASSVNLLMLDEPTNHLDIPSMEIIQQVLADFDGSAVIVSHDRYLVQSIATDVWAIDDGEVRCIPGGWEAYLDLRRRRLAEKSAEAADGNGAGKAAKQDRKADYQESRRQANLMQRLKRRHEQLEALIESAEAALAKLNEDISHAGQAGQVQRVAELGVEYQKTDEQLKELWREWEEVGTQIE